MKLCFLSRANSLLAPFIGTKAATEGINPDPLLRTQKARLAAGFGHTY
jgi:hypothetical protein